MQPTKRRVLCVNENDDTRFLLSNLLEQSGYEVATAPTAREALRLAADKRFDLCLLGKRFLDHSAIDLCRELRRRWPATPVLFYSADAYESSRREAFGRRMGLRA